MADTPTTTAELLLTAPDAQTLARLVLLMRAVAEGAALSRSTAPPWQLRVERGTLDGAAWRRVLTTIIELY